MLPKQYIAVPVDKQDIGEAIDRVVCESFTLTPATDLASRKNNAALGTFNCPQAGV